MRNKEVFAKVEGIGTLYLYDVLLAYIYPRVFVCEDLDNNKFLFYEMSNANNKDIWLVTQITEKEYLALKERKMAIQEAYENSSSLFLISKTYKKEGNKMELSFDVEEWIDKLPKKLIYAEKTRR